jgi:predicted RNA-binding Zn-ribbon protein involved in translation (DUF1610 family)
MNQLDEFLDGLEGLDIVQPEPRAEETGNCPNCAEVIIREVIYQNNVPHFFWPCPHCGFTHHGPEIPALD